MKLKPFLKLSFWVAVYVYCIGFLMPMLFSSDSDFSVFLGVLVFLALLYDISNFKIWKTILNEFKNNLKINKNEETN